MLPSVGRGARYFLLGLALPTFLSLLHLNLKILLLQGTGEWEGSGASSAWAQQRASAAAAASLDAIERLQGALAEEQMQVVVGSHARARALKEATKQVDARLKVPGLQLYFTNDDSELEPGATQHAWQRRLLGTELESESEAQAQPQRQPRLQSQSWLQSQSHSQAQSQSRWKAHSHSQSQSQEAEDFLGQGDSTEEGEEDDDVGEAPGVPAELLHWLIGPRGAEDMLCEGCRVREVGARSTSAHSGRKLQQASEAQEDPEVAGVSLSADGETAEDEEEGGGKGTGAEGGKSESGGAEGGAEFVIRGGKEGSDETGDRGANGENRQQASEAGEGFKLTQEESERLTRLAVAKAQAAVAALEERAQSPPPPQGPSALALLMRRRKVVADQLKMPMQLLMGQQTTATQAKVETLQEGVIKLVRRTELKERIARCHSLLLSLTMLNQAICNGETSPWCRDAPWLHFSPGRCTRDNDGRSPSVADKSTSSASEGDNGGADSAGETGDRGTGSGVETGDRAAREDGTPDGSAPVFQVRRQWQAKHEALVSRACKELADFLHDAQCHTQWPVPGTPTRTTNPRGAVSGQLVDCGLQEICAARAKRRAHRGCTGAKGEGGLCAGGRKESESENGNESGSESENESGSESEGESGPGREDVGGRGVPDRVEIHTGVAEEEANGMREKGGSKGRAADREKQRESLLAAPSVLWRVQRSGKWGDDGTGGLLKGWDASSGRRRSPAASSSDPLHASKSQAGSGNESGGRSRSRRRRGGADVIADVSQGSREEERGQPGLGTATETEADTVTGAADTVTEGERKAPPLDGDGGHKVSVLLQYFKHPGEIPVILGHYYACSRGVSDRGEIGGLRAELLAFIDETSGWKQWRAEWNKSRGHLFFRGVFSHNFHESRGYNRLASSARGSLLFLIQDDDIPPSSCSWMDKGLQLFKARPLLAIAGFRHGLWRWRNTGWQPVPGTPPWRPRGPTEYIPNQEQETKVRAYFPSVLDVGPLAVRRSVWQSVGGLDEGLSRWGETHAGYADYDLAYRTWIHGREVMHVGGNKDTVMTGASSPGETHKFSASLVFRDINLHLNRKWVQRLVTWIGPRLERELGRKNRDLLTKDAWVRDSDGNWTK